MINPNPREWAKSQVIDTTTAAARCGVPASNVRAACIDGRIANAWKPSEESRVWLMFWDDVRAWRKAVRKYEKKT